MAKYIKAESGSKNTVIYTDNEKNQFEYRGGSRTWRNNNPGNLVSATVSKRNGEIGKAGGFAVFPDYDSGHAALIDLLKNVFSELSLKRLISKYAPKHENDTKQYLKLIRIKTGVKSDKKIKDFTSSEFEKLWKAIEQMEGWKIGRITKLPVKAEIKSVKKDKNGIIIQYLIEGFGWVTKEKGITLTISGKVNAAVVTSSLGNQFLRAKPNKTNEDNLGNLG